MTKLRVPPGLRPSIKKEIEKSLDDISQTGRFPLETVITHEQLAERLTDAVMGVSLEQKEGRETLGLGGAYCWD